jgi:hypothetical protein
MEALGAKPKKVPSGAKLDGLDGLDQQLASIVGNHYFETARYVTANVNLWPRPLVLFMGKELATSLTPAQRRALSSASDKSIAPALDASRAEDQDGATTLCKAGMQFAVASDADLAALHAALQPVYDELNSHPDTKTAVDAITSLKTTLAAGPDSPPCSSPAPSSPASAKAAIPNGTYEMTVTVNDKKGCNYWAPDASGVSFNVMVLKDGHVEMFTEIGRRGGQREHTGAGSYRVFRDKFEFTDAFTSSKETGVWSFDGRQLTLSHWKAEHTTDNACVGTAVWTAHPWVLTRASG